MGIEILASITGSNGNASVISDSETFLQIDCGVSYKTLNRLMGYEMYRVHNAIVTHGHSDHIAYASDFMRYGVKVWATTRTWNAGFILGKNRTNLRTFEQGKQFEIGTFIIKPFPVAHTNRDGTECENSGLIIYSKITKERLLWVTDTAYIEYKFPALDYIAIECSYFDIDDYSNELDYINKYVEQRRLKSHLSYNRCVKFLKMQDLSKCKWIKLLHISKSQGDIANNMKEKLEKEFTGMEVIV